jgi:hypothetical protein
MWNGVLPITWAFIGPRYDLIPWVYKDVPRRVQAAWDETGPDALCQSGGAIGVDTLAKEAWNAIPGAEPCKNIRPKYNPTRGYAYNAQRALERNGDVVAVDRVVAWWNGASRGTRNAMGKAWGRGSLYEVRFFNEVVWSQGMEWNPFDYGEWMATMMYNPTQLKYAALLITQKVGRSTGLDQKRKTEYSLRITEGEHWLLRGNRPEKLLDGSLKFGPMKRPDREKLEIDEEPRGHTVNIGMECTCEAGQHGRPCWARGAAWIVRYVESYQTVGVYADTEGLEHEIMEPA